MNALLLLTGGFAVGLIVIGAVLASLADGRGIALTALTLQYGGVAIILWMQAGPISGISALVIGLGSLLILASTGALRLPSDPANPPPSNSRWFGASITGLAVMGAVGLSLSHPLFGSVATNIVVGTLVLVGLLLALLGGAARLVFGLIFLSSAAGLMLRLADPSQSMVDSILLAAAQLILVIGLGSLWAQPTRPAPPARRRARRTYYRRPGVTSVPTESQPAPGAAKAAQ